jgi:hypothetical protein
MVRHRRLALALLPLVLLLSGCPKDPYTAAMAGSKDVSDAISAAIPVVHQLEVDKLITSAQQSDVLGYLTKVTEANQTFRTTVKQVHTTNAGNGPAQYLNAADVFVNAVKNQTVVNVPAKLQPYLTAIDTAIKGIEIAISNAKGVPH